jgi:ATP-dependent DNA ligase
MAAVLRTAFIPPCQPNLRKEPPNHRGWLHEVKFDGFRIQLHKHGKEVALFSKGGAFWNDRYPTIAKAVAKLPTKAVIFDVVEAEGESIREELALHLPGKHQRTVQAAQAKALIEPDSLGG